MAMALGSVMCLARLRLQILGQGFRRLATGRRGHRRLQRAVERAGRADRAGATFETGVPWAQPVAARPGSNSAEGKCRRSASRTVEEARLVGAGHEFRNMRSQGSRDQFQDSLLAVRTVEQLVSPDSKRCLFAVRSCSG